MIVELGAAKEKAYARYEDLKLDIVNDYNFLQKNYDPFSTAGKGFKLMIEQPSGCSGSFSSTFSTLSCHDSNIFGIYGENSLNGLFWGPWLGQNASLDFI